MRWGLATALGTALVSYNSSTSGGSSPSKALKRRARISVARN
jgi:hypothetical protein